jgi:hypothetical protein
MYGGRASPWNLSIAMCDNSCAVTFHSKVPYITQPKATGGSRGSPPGILDLLQCMILLVSRDSSKVPYITLLKATGVLG